MQRNLDWLFAALAVLAALPGYGAALALLRRSMARATAPAWWFGYLRDGVNAAAVLALWAILAWAGYPGPAAFLLGFAVAFAAYALDGLFGAVLGNAAAFALAVVPAGIAALALVWWGPAFSPHLLRLLLSVGGG